MMQERRTAAGVTVESVRAQIAAQYHANPRVRISVQMPHSRLVQAAEVTITGVYPHVFCVEEIVGGAVQRHSFQYADVLTRRVEIEGLD